VIEVKVIPSISLERGHAVLIAGFQKGGKTKNSYTPREKI
jgi:hypothetical protein